MYKKIFSLFSLVCISVVVYAQEPYYNIQDYKKSIKINFRDLQIDSVVPGQSGRDVVWDFSGLRDSGRSSSSQILSPDSIAEAEFPNTNYIEKYTNGSFMAYSREGGRTYLMGFYDPGSQTKIQYILPLLLSRRPLFFKDKISSAYKVVYQDRDKKFSGAGRVTLEADGHGTLLLPDGRYEDVLRVSLEQTQENTIKDSVRSRYDTITKAGIKTYFWYQRDVDTPLLKLTESVSGGKRNTSLQRLTEESTQLLNIK